MVVLRLPAAPAAAKTRPPAIPVRQRSEPSSQRQSTHQPLGRQSFSMSLPRLQDKGLATAAPTRPTRRQPPASTSASVMLFSQRWCEDPAREPQSRMLYRIGSQGIGSQALLRQPPNAESSDGFSSRVPPPGLAVSASAPQLRPPPTPELGAALFVPASLAQPTPPAPPPQQQGQPSTSASAVAEPAAAAEPAGAGPEGPDGRRLTAAEVQALKDLISSRLLFDDERVALLRKSPLFAPLDEQRLYALAEAATEKECKARAHPFMLDFFPAPSRVRYRVLRPTRCLYVLYEGHVTVQKDTHLALTRPLPAEVMAAAPDTCAAAAKAVALDGAVAGLIRDQGATLGLANLVGGLSATPDAYLVTEPSFLLQLPVEAVREALQMTRPVAAGPGCILDSVRCEARLRMLLALPFLRQSNALAGPTPREANRVRSLLAAATELEVAHPGTRLCRAGDSPAEALLLLHGRVDLYDDSGRLVCTVDESAPAPLGGFEAVEEADDAAELPYGTAPPPPPPPAHLHTAVAADTCHVLRGGPAAAAALRALLALPSTARTAEDELRDGRVYEEEDADGDGVPDSQQQAPRALTPVTSVLGAAARMEAIGGFTLS